MPRAISFSVTFPSEAHAKDFVRRVTHTLESPTLRYEALVHVVAMDPDQMKAILIIARSMGAVDL